MAAKRVLDLEDVEDDFKLKAIKTESAFKFKTESELVADLTDLPTPNPLFSPAKSLTDFSHCDSISYETSPTKTLPVFSPSARANSGSILCENSPTKPLAVFSPSAREIKNKAIAEFRLKTSKEIVNLNQLWNKEKKAKVWDEHRQAKNDFDQASLNMKNCDLRFKMAELRVAELRNILAQRKLLEAAWNETVIID